MTKYEFPTADLAADVVASSAIWQRSENELTAAYRALLRAGVPQPLLTDLGDAAHAAAHAGKRMIRLRFTAAMGSPVSDARRAKLEREADEAAAKLASVCRAVVASAKAHVAPEPHDAAD